MIHHGIIRRVGNNDSAIIDLLASAAGTYRLAVFPRGMNPVIREYQVPANGLISSGQLIGHVTPSGPALFKAEFPNGGERLLLQQNSGVSLLWSDPTDLRGTSFRAPIGAPSTILVGNATGNTTNIQIAVNGALVYDQGLAAFSTHEQPVLQGAWFTVTSGIDVVVQIATDYSGQRQSAVLVSPS